MNADGDVSFFVHDSTISKQTVCILTNSAHYAQHVSKIQMEKNPLNFCIILFYYFEYGRIDVMVFCKHEPTVLTAKITGGLMGKAPLQTKPNLHYSILLLSSSLQA